VPERDHFVENTAQRPDIRFLVIGLLLADLWREIVWRSNGCLGAVVGVLQDSGNSEITDFDRTVLIHKYVLCLQISVQNFPVVNVLDCQSHLDKPV
jgi:hypothetical protein